MSGTSNWQLERPVGVYEGDGTLIRLREFTQDVARAGELQAATRQVLEESTRTVKEKLHTKGRHRKQCRLHLRVGTLSLLPRTMTTCTLACHPLWRRRPLLASL